MANALMKLVRNNDIDALEKSIADLQTKKTALTQRQVNVERERRVYALDVEQGDTAAKKQLEKVNAAAIALEQELKNNEAAIEGARERLADAEAKDEQEELRRRIAQQDKRAKRYMTLAEKAEKQFRGLVPIFNEMDTLGAEMVKEQRDLMPRHDREGKVIGSPHGLGSGAIYPRLWEFLVSIGLGAYLNLDNIVGAGAAGNQKSLVDRVRLVVDQYKITEPEARRKKEAEASEKTESEAA